jgi:hypothetical protein
VQKRRQDTSLLRRGYVKRFPPDVTIEFGPFLFSYSRRPPVQISTRRQALPWFFLVSGKRAASIFKVKETDGQCVQMLSILPRRNHEENIYF